jgi:hypothetical protein
MTETPILEEFNGFLNTVSYRPIARQRPRNKQQDNSCYLVTVAKHVNDIRDIARQPSIATIEELLDPPPPLRGDLTRTPGRRS